MSSARRSRTSVESPQGPTIPLDEGEPDLIPGDLAEEQVEALRRNLSSTAQLHNAAEAVKLLASEQQSLLRVGQGSAPTLPSNTDDILMSQLGLAEANARLAQAGHTPLNTLEAKIQALQFVTKHVIETAKLEPMAKLEAEKLILQYRQLLVSQTAQVQISRLQAENQELTARTEQITLQHGLLMKQKGSIEDLNVEAKARDADRREKSVEINKRNIDLIEEERRMRREEQIAKRTKANQDWKSKRRLWIERYGATRRRLITAAVVLVIVANLVADDSGRADTAVLGAVNRTWDAIYTPIRAGILRSIDNVGADNDNEAQDERGPQQRRRARRQRSSG